MLKAQTPGLLRAASLVAALSPAAVLSLVFTLSLLFALSIVARADQSVRSSETSGASPAPLAQYRARVHQAMLGVDVLSAGDVSEKLISPTLVYIRRMLPKSEQVEWSGGVLEVNNEWLHRALDDYESTARISSEDERHAMLRAIAERLHALEARLVEVESGRDAAVRDKDAEKGRLAKILRGPDFNRETSKGGALGRLLDDFLGGLQELIPSLRGLRLGPNSLASTVAQVLVVTLALAVVAFFVRRQLARRGARLRPVELGEARVVLGEHLAPGETPADLLAEAERLARGGDLRAAMRKSYVALLCEFGERKIIRLAHHKTNRDYLRDLSRSARLHNLMRPLTASFERHWYGREAASEADWNDFRTRCRQALEHL